tara:strand:- start:509 stop:4381 length:3873 start_codon:yes stop_codon:yes gene_type:complete
MPAYLQETARSFPNPISGEEYNTTWKRPSSGDYESHSSGNGLGTGTDYFITFEGSGPGSYPLGKDAVHYIGDQEETCIANCGYTRAPVYRWYRGAKRDHKYTKKPEMIEADAGCENESWKKISSGYNHEPRKGTPYFFCLDRQQEGSVPLVMWYSYWPDNCVLVAGTGNPPGVNTGCGKGKYYKCYTLGYIFTSLSDAQEYGDDAVPLYHYRYGSQSASKGKDIDDFYTINPAGEVNLEDNPIPCRKPMDREYQYQGIIGYVYPADAPSAPQQQVIDVGRIGPTGQCVDKTGWYEFDDETGPFNWRVYNRGGYPGGYPNGPASATPGVIGFGNPDNAEIIDAEANFEWAYGLNGAIKGAVPRFLGFEDSYDSQFYYYLYDTTYPWNGPLFGIQYELNDIPCCPNTTCNDSNSGRPRPCCVPNEHFYSHFYQIRQDSWETTKTRCVLTDTSTNGVNESFETIDTDSPRVLFRYTTRTGDFNRGEEINGWNIVSVFYYGDQLKCGLMELEGGTNAFSYLQQFTSTDGGTVEILAGYGIANKCAFAGVYEFPKKVSYYKVELSPKALVPNRTLDEAKLEAIINNKGAISEVEIINSGRGYSKNAKVTAITPKVLNNFSPTDTTEHLDDLIRKDYNAEEAIGFTESEFSGDDPIKDVQVAYGTFSGATEFPTDHDGIASKLKAATLEIAAFDEIGGIKKIRVIDGGSGYSQEEPPDVFISDPEYIEYESPDIGDIAALGQGISNQFEFMNDGIPVGEDQDPNSWINTNTGNDFGGAPTQFQSLGTTGIGSATSPNQVANTGFTIMNTPIASAAPDSYIRMAEIDEENETKLCFDLPPNCLEVDGRGNVMDAIPKEDFWEIVSGVSPGVREFESQVMPSVYQGVGKLEEYQEQTSHVYGPFNKDRCLTMGQPKIYNIRRWFDMPCAYVSTVERGSQTLDMIEKGRNLSDDRAFGYLPYKYCASKIKEAEFNVSIMVEGKVIGSMGQDFMDYMDSFTKPKVTPRRKVSGGYKTWNCNNGDVDGRCYRDPNDANDIIFVPVGLDENTFDYNRNGFSEYEQFRLWLGDNLTGGGLTSAQTTFSWVDDETTTDSEGNSQTTNYGGTNSTAYTAFTVDCSPDPGSTNVPNHDCWDKYVRASGAPSDAPLDVYCGWDASGNPMSGERFWEIRGPANGTNPSGHTTPTGPVNPFCAQCGGSGYTGGLVWSYLSQTTSPPAVGLSSVNDASIAIDPTRIYQNSDGDKAFKMGSYSGTMRVRNWLTGGVQALSNSLKNFGNPYFSECDVARPDEAGKRINQEFE